LKDTNILKRPIELFNLNDEVVDAWTVRTASPFAIVADAVYFVVQPDSAALRHFGLLHTLSALLPNEDAT
jgi:hypothetical protein